MTHTFLELSQLTNRALLVRVDELVRRERRVQAALIANLSELDARRLYLGEGCSSFYVYCVERLGYSESAAYRRMEAARAARKFPVVLDRLADGSLNLSTVALLAKHLTAANHRELLDAAAGKSRVEVEALIARVRGVEAALPRSTVRVVTIAAPASAPRGVAGAGSAERGDPKPEAHPAAADITKSTSAGGSDVPGMAAVPTPAEDGPTEPRAEAIPSNSAPSTALAYRHAITLTADEQADLDRARELLRAQVPNGDPARLIGRALKQLVATLEARKFGAAKKPRPARTAPTAPSRAIPAAVRREVTTRDAGRCTFVAANGHRCTERGALEFHHRRPVAKAGPATAENLTLLCAAHHRRESERVFGPARTFAGPRVTSAGGSAPPGPGG